MCTEHRDCSRKSICSSVKCRLLVDLSMMPWRGWANFPLGRVQFVGTSACQVSACTQHSRLRDPSPADLDDSHTACMHNAAVFTAPPPPPPPPRVGSHVTDICGRKPHTVYRTFSLMKACLVAYSIIACQPSPCTDVGCFVREGVMLAMRRDGKSSPETVEVCDGSTRSCP